MVNSRCIRSICTAVESGQSSLEGCFDCHHIGLVCLRTVGRTFLRITLRSQGFDWLAVRLLSRAIQA